jgi:hypothetical protein
MNPAFVPTILLFLSSHLNYLEASSPINVFVNLTATFSLPDLVPLLLELLEKDYQQKNNKDEILNIK